MFCQGRDVVVGYTQSDTRIIAAYRKITVSGLWLCYVCVESTFFWSRDQNWPFPIISP
jgi:hypothetical protein